LALGQAIYESVAQQPDHKLRARATDDCLHSLASAWRNRRRPELAALAVVANQAICAEGRGVTALLARNGTATQFLGYYPTVASR
jgi:hypothetical protein